MTLENCQVDWITLSFPVLVALALLWVYRIDRDPANKFKVVQFLSHPDGTADKYALAYVLVLLVGTWGVWYMFVTNRLTEWMWTSFIGAFVLGAAWKTAASAFGSNKVQGDDSQEPNRVIK